MNKFGPILVIEDDPDDVDVFEEIFQKLGFLNEVIYFSNGDDALAYFHSGDIQPFLIISDINMPRLNGLELKRRVFLDEKLQARCIPYLFFTTSANKYAVETAYALSAQGFFIKPDTMLAFENTLRNIISYWQECVLPNAFAELPRVYRETLEVRY